MKGKKSPDGPARGAKPRKKQVPADSQSFANYIRCLTQRIDVLTRHLSVVSNARDTRARYLLERLIDERGTALSQPPPTIPSEFAEKLREEVSLGVRAAVR